MQEAEGSLGIGIERAPVGARGLQQREGADDIGLDELGRAVDGAVHMALGGEMHDRARTVGSEQAVDRLAIADIGLREHVARVAFQRGERLAVACVGQLVDADDGIRACVTQPAEHEVRTDEPRPARYEDIGQLFCPCRSIYILRARPMPSIRHTPCGLAGMSVCVEVAVFYPTDSPSYAP